MVSLILEHGFLFIVTETLYAFARLMYAFCALKFHTNV